jgi:RHS repeat-associated protein
VLDADFTADSVNDDGYSDIDNRHLYTGREREPENGLQLNRHRYYASHLGRWITRDPIEYESGLWNLYQYVASQPIKLVDPLGEDGYEWPVSNGIDAPCTFTIHCWHPAPWPTFGRHCGLTICCGRKCERFDGSGGGINRILISSDIVPDDKRGFQQGDPKALEKWRYDCLKEYRNEFNRHQIPRGDLGGNSNWTLNCMMTKCGLEWKWGWSGPPIGFNTPPVKRCPGRYCCEYYGCPDEMSGPFHPPTIDLDKFPIETGGSQIISTIR